MTPPRVRQYGQEPQNQQGEQTNQTVQNQDQTAERKPDAKTVQDFHTNADTDAKDTSIHHTLGPRPTQAASGDHRHDGGDSALLLEGFTISGSKSTQVNAVLGNIISCLVRLGAKDATT